MAIVYVAVDVKGWWGGEPFFYLGKKVSSLQSRETQCGLWLLDSLESVLHKALRVLLHGIRFGHSRKFASSRSLGSPK